MPRDRSRSTERRCTGCAAICCRSSTSIASCIDATSMPRADAQAGTCRRPRSGRRLDIVVLQADDRQFGLIVDAIHDTEEIVVKPLQKQTKGISAFAGATIMGDGKVALILDVLGLAQKANVVSGVRDRSRRQRNRPRDRRSAAGREPDRAPVRPHSDGGRMAIPLSQVARLEEFSGGVLERRSHVGSARSCAVPR